MEWMKIVGWIWAVALVWCAWDFFKAPIMPADWNEEGISPDYELDEDVQAFLEHPANNKEPHEMGDTHEYIQGGLTRAKGKKNGSNN
jgi:hypothetical protein|tara:strand:+ start:80 stop:340 length:261 start_codon:yes stop_codon:yes gene_type:complete